MIPYKIAELITQCKNDKREENLWNESRVEKKYLNFDFNRFYNRVKLTEAE